MIKEHGIGWAIIILFVISIGISRLDTTPREAAQRPASLLTTSKEGIAVITLAGPISFPQSQQALLSQGADDLLQQLDQLEKNPHVKAVLLRINSPGGTVGAAQEIYARLKQLKDSKNVPVVAHIADVGASGAYYAALAADDIYANPGSLVGSIGVILGNINVTKLAKNQGVAFDVYKSGPFKDTLSMWRSATEEEKRRLQGVVDDVHDQFKTVLIQSRGLDQKSAQELAQGQVFTGRQAAQLGLIDGIATSKEVIAMLGERVGLGKDPAVFYMKQDQWQSVLGLLNMTINSLPFPFMQSTPLPLLR